MSTPSAQNHYEVLGINAQATPEEVERAYRFTLELYGDGALATYSLLDPAEVRRARGRVQEAYEVLRDPARRQAYDQSHGLASVGAPRAAPSNLRAWPQPAARPGESGGVASPPGDAPVMPPAAFSGNQATAPAMAAEAAPAPAPPVPAAVPFEATPPQILVPLPAPGASPARAAGSSPPLGRTPHVLPEPVTGALLRRYREERGVSLRDIANQSKIGTRYLEYIEGDRLDMLPAAVYLRGFLQEYARALGLDPRRTANAYMAQFPRPWPQE